jgi:hypothetical protein
VKPSRFLFLKSGSPKTEHSRFPAGTRKWKFFAIYSLIIKSRGVLLTITPLLFRTIFLQKISQLGLIFIREISTPIIVKTLCSFPLISRSTMILEVDSPRPPIGSSVAKSKMELTPHILSLLPTSYPMSTTLSSKSYLCFNCPPSI